MKIHFEKGNLKPWHDGWHWEKLLLHLQLKILSNWQVTTPWLNLADPSFCWHLRTASSSKGRRINLLKIDPKYPFPSLTKPGLRGRRGRRETANYQLDGELMEGMEKMTGFMDDLLEEEGEGLWKDRGMRGSAVGWQGARSTCSSRGPYSIKWNSMGIPHCNAFWNLQMGSWGTIYMIMLSNSKVGYHGIGKPTDRFRGPLNIYFKDSRGS